MEINIYQVDAFTSNAFSGNPAVVVPDAHVLSDEEMQKIANELNVSETAFVSFLDKDLYEVRYFTPKKEVELCGHGTIATFYTLALKGYIEPIYNGKKTVYQVTKAGKLPVEIEFKDNEVKSIIMEVARPRKLKDIEDITLTLKAIGIDESKVGIGNRLVMPEIISTGLSDIILPIKDKETLDNLKVNYLDIIDITRDLDVVGIHAFYLPKKDSSKVYGRNFAPIVGINEEAATGTSNGSLIYFLKKNNLISQNKITAIQGESLNRPSEIECYIHNEKDEYKVKVGGRAKIVVEGIMNF